MSHHVDSFLHPSGNGRSSSLVAVGKNSSVELGRRTVLNESVRTLPSASRRDGRSSKARSAAAPLAASMTAVIVAKGFWNDASSFPTRRQSLLQTTVGILPSSGS